MRAILSTFAATSAWAVLATAAVGQDPMPWQPNLETAQRVAGETNRLVLIHFWAPWCRPCIRMDKEVFANPETAKGLEANFVFVKLNADETPGTTRLYGVSSLPTDVITTPAGRMVSQIQSPPTASQYISQMNQAAEGHRSLARKPESQNVQQAAPPANNGAAYAPPNPPAATPIAGQPPTYQSPAAAPAGPQNARGNDRYAEYFPDEQAARAPVGAPDARVTPAQAYAAVPATPPADAHANQVDPYAAPPSAAQPPAVDPYAGPPPAAQPPTAQPPAADPYASTPAVARPPAADPYATPSPVAQPPAAPAYRPPSNPAQPQIAQAPYQAQPSGVQLPPGCPPVGLDGHCPVTLVERKRWSQGHPSFGAVHRGRTYLFLGPQERDKFLADPDRFSPVLSGVDPVLALDNQAAVPGRREFGVFGADGHVYLFADEASRARFEANEQTYAARALQATQSPAQYQAMRPNR